MAQGTIPVGLISDDPMWRVDFASSRPFLEVVPLPSVRAAIEQHATAAPVLLRIGDVALLERDAALLAGNPQLVVVGLADDVTVEVLRAAMGAGLFTVIAADATEDVLREALTAADERAQNVALHSLVGEAVRPTAAWLVVVTSAKGGQGATTVATNLALALHDDPERNVILVDGDMRFGDIGSALGYVQGVRNPFVEADLPGAPEWARPYLWRHGPSGLATILPPRIRSVPDELPKDVAMRALGMAQTLCEIVVVDMPFWGIEYTHVDAWADAIVLVSSDLPRDLDNAAIAASIFRPNCDKGCLVISKYVDGRTPKRKDLKKRTGLDVFARIPEHEDQRRRAEEGRPAVLDDPEGAAAQEYRQLAARLLEQLRSPVDS